jgi:hypothetical protein
VDKAVKNSIVKPGQYLILEFDFSCVARPRNIDESVEFLRGEINRRLSRFKIDYTEFLGQSFASETSGFKENNPAGNLAGLVEAVDCALQGIQKRGDEGHPLWGVRGVCLFQITTHYPLYILTSTDLFASG